MDAKNSIQSEHSLYAAARSYDFQVHTASEGDRFLLINEVQSDRSNCIVVNEEHWADFTRSLMDILERNRTVNEPVGSYITGEPEQFERLDQLVSETYGKRTTILTLLENAGLSQAQSRQVLQQFRSQVTLLLMENFRGFLHSRQFGDRLWEILVQRYGLNGSAPDTFQDIAERWDISPDKAQQLVEQAYRKLRLQQRRRRLEANLRVSAEGWLGIRLDLKTRQVEPGSAEEKRTPEYILNTQKKYSRAYELWTEEEDSKLLVLSREGYPVDELAEQFSRQPGAIRARLTKLTGDTG